MVIGLSVVKLLVPDFATCQVTLSQEVSDFGVNLKLHPGNCNQLNPLLTAVVKAGCVQRQGAGQAGMINCTIQVQVVVPHFPIIVMV